MSFVRFSLVAALLVGLVGSAGSAFAEEVASGEGNDFLDAFKNGKFTLNIRARYEEADVSDNGADKAKAPTIRTRLGYGTADYYGFSGFIEYEGTQGWGNKYNALDGGNTDYDVVADPSITELNRAWLKFTAPEGWGTPGYLKYGRQRIILDDARFVGNVGWRQNEQTFNATRLATSAGVEGLNLEYTYMSMVIPVTGLDNSVSSANHLINGRYKIADWMTVAAFGYWLEDKDNDAGNSATYGVRLNGDIAITDGLSIPYQASYARQTEYEDGPEYDADYYMVDGGIKVKSCGTFGTGFEVLGASDDGPAFSTPLATKHKFNGWADVFLATPVEGLQDIYAYYALPKFDAVKGLGGKLVYHKFDSNEEGISYGQEFDIVLSYALNKHVKFLAKYADYQADDDGPANPRANDVSKWWLQTEFVF